MLEKLSLLEFVIILRIKKERKLSQNRLKKEDLEITKK